MTPLKQRILGQIKDTGPISIAAYMAQCLLDPTHGYYPTRDPLGVDGDFITAPEISQMFGEVLGLWVINTWRVMGEPKTLHLIEYGPGRGVMMSDILRTTRLDPACHKAIQLHLIETSAALEAKQAETLASAGVSVNWASRIEDVEDGPTIVIGNEYLDCLPIRQFVMKDRFAGPAGLHERMIDVHPENPEKLAYTVRETAIAQTDIQALPHDLPDFKNDDLLEVNTGLAHMAQQLAARFTGHHPGAALFIDYGPLETEFGDTFQAVHKHQKVYPLDAPGQADLTARVDFAHLSELSLAENLSVFGPTTQAELLSKLGIEMRAVSLSKQNPDAKAKIGRQLNRLTGADEMGTLFKAICLQSKTLPAPLGFTEAQ